MSASPCYFRDLPGSGDLIILGHMALSDVLRVDVMEDLRRIVNHNRKRRDDGVGRTYGNTKETPGHEGTPGNG